ncbi:hypothetical protein Tco_0336036 [Tanacetum coccineum]
MNHITNSAHYEAKKAPYSRTRIRKSWAQSLCARDGSVFRQWCDLRIELLSRFWEFFDDSFASKSKSYFKESLEGLYNLYYAKYGNPTRSSQTSGGATSSKASGRNKYSRLLNGLKAHTKKWTQGTDPNMWFLERTKEIMYLGSIQPKMGYGFNKCYKLLLGCFCIRIFKQVGRVFLFNTKEQDSLRRLRAFSLCLKDHLDAKERKQDKSPLEIPLDFEEDVLDDEVQRNEAIPLSDEEILQ